MTLQRDAARVASRQLPEPRTRGQHDQSHAASQGTNDGEAKVARALEALPSHFWWVFNVKVLLEKRTV